MVVYRTNGLSNLKNNALENIDYLSILVLNIMPNKIEAENQLNDLFEKLPEYVKLTFMYPASHKWKHGNVQALKNNYVTLDQIKSQYFDGLIITGAPLEQLNYSDVDFWPEFIAIRDWSKTHTKYQLFTCWAALAGLYLDFNIPKINLNKKIFGVYQNQLSNSEFTSGFRMPQSRMSGVERRIIQHNQALQILCDNQQTGPFLLKSNRAFYTLGHPEYSAQTLINEYRRDLSKGKEIREPNNLSLTNPNKDYQVWHSNGQYLYHNWLNKILEEL